MQAGPPLVLSLFVNLTVCNRANTGPTGEMSVFAAPTSGGSLASDVTAASANRRD